MEELYTFKKYLTENTITEDVDFTTEEQDILDNKSTNLGDSSEFQGILKSILNTEIKKSEFFNEVLDQYNNVVSDYSKLYPKTKLEKQLFSIKLAKGSRADNIGPGEAFIVLATKNTYFSSGGGDVTSNGIDIEIKKSTGKEFAVTYTAGGVFKFFPQLSSLNSLVDNMRDTLQDYLPKFKSLSPNSRLLFRYLAKGFNSLKINPKLDFEGTTFVNSFKEYKNLFSLKRGDFIESEVDSSFIDDVKKDISRKISSINTEDFKQGFVTTANTYFGKGFEYILFYKGKDTNVKPYLFEAGDMEQVVDTNVSQVRNGYTIYLSIKKELLKEAEEKYTSGEKLDRGYGLTVPFMRFIENGLKQLINSIS
tara:strand:- start:211 stop:1305 length:1095 start_codon:yes stop_codon:yes gene_type:complete